MPGQGPFTPLYPTVQNVFNPARYYSESGQKASDVPGVPEGSFGSMASLLVPFLVLVLVLWALERRRLGLGFRLGVNS